MPDPTHLTYGIITIVVLCTASWCAYKAGVYGERANHYRWMAQGWRMASDHIDFVMLTRPPQEEALQQHLTYMTDVFSMKRPYPPEKEEEEIS